MSKNTKFSGKPIISQVLSLLDKHKINRTAQKNKSDRYYKKFKTIDHLVTMLYVVLSGCSSLREITGIMLACEGRINHLGIDNFPKRSTISDANKKRSSNVFQEIYYDIFNSYSKIISDSRINDKVIKELMIIDSTTISLFCDILKGTGREPINGKKKGGIKMHTMINAAEDVPCLIRLTSAAVHDHTFLKDLNLKKGSIVVFDKGYNDYKQFAKWEKEEIYFVTRIKSNAKYNSVNEYDIADDIDSGVIKDEKIEIANGKEILQLRKVGYWDEKNRRLFEFITNNFNFPADKIAEIYKRRWQIELLFKRLKQSFPLKYFLGDSINAIEIQIWVSLIAQILLLVIQKLAKKRWAFSNLMSVIRFHLMTYIDLFAFLANPDSGWDNLKSKSDDQLELFSSA